MFRRISRTEPAKLAVGVSAMTGNNNTAVGESAPFSDITGGDNVDVGFNARWQVLIEEMRTSQSSIRSPLSSLPGTKMLE